MNKSSEKLIYKTFTRQHDHSDCGVACLLSIVKYYSGSGELEHYREISGTNKEGTTLLGLVQAANQIGFEAEGYEADIPSLIEQEQPLILHVIINKKLSHYVVCYGFSENHFVIGDPGVGIKRMSKEEVEEVWVSKKCFTLTPSKDFKTKKEVDHSKKQWVKALIKEDIQILSSSIALGVGLAVLGLAMALYKKKLVDTIIPDKNMEALFIGTIAIGFLLLLKSGLSAIRGTLLIEQSRQFNIRITGSFLSKLLYLPKPFFDTRKIGDFVARLNDSTRIQRVISQLVSSTIIDLIVTIVTLSFLFFFSWEIGLTAVFGLGLYFVIIYQNNGRIVSAQKSVMGNYASNESHYIDMVSGITDIKSYHKYNQFLSSNKNIFSKFQDSIFQLGKLNIKLSLLASIISTLLMLAIIATGSVLVISEEMKLGSLIAIFGVTLNLIGSVANLAMVAIPLNEAKVAFDRMFAFSGFSNNEIDGVQSVNDIHSININQLSFSFPGRDSLLENISITLNKGSITTLLGESGGGKSTILNIIQKFYPFSNGSISINNDLQLNTISTPSWNKKVSFVPQNVHIFNGTVFENITLTSNQQDWAEAKDLCDKLGITSFINQFPQGFLSVVGDGGVNLSGGQKQIVALVRALFHRPQVLLLDEATSAMDRNTENFILNLLKRLKKQMIILIVTHQIKTASKSDYIYILEDKMIALHGTPEDLMMSDNFYSEGLTELVTR